ncbi:outer membrane protein transport protein [Sulfurimonas sp. HSL3-7]|uniref:OmpP1/FadL family transporter n=1 Tax=Sulfonitrofixus jiaomeiensis TaxID=3131938 RepID=UPI0031F95FBB
MKKLLVVSAVAATSLMASGYKIPEQSLNSTALSGAYVSNTSAADAAYYNPANMAFMSSDKHLELNAMYIHLNPIEFSGSVGGSEDHTAESASEDFVIPQIYVVSTPLDENEDFRLGLSVNAPAGLSKRWPSGVEAAFAEEFTLKVIEVNPTLSYRIMDNLAIAVGARFVYSEGIIKTSSEGGGLDLEGNSWDLGYNLALSYKPYESWGMALTYRSNVDLTEEGGDTFTHPTYGTMTTPASVTVPLPAVLTIATDVDVTDSTNLELVYERAFWSAYDELNIKIPAFGTLPGQPADKSWEDTNTVRLGLTQELDDYFDLMLGLAYDETPVPEKTLGFELPDSNAIIFSGGIRWAVNDAFDIGAAVLYDAKEDRTVSSDTIDGTFSGSSALLVSVGLGYRF